MAVNEILPVPLAPRPIAVFEFVQLYTVPGTAPVKVAVVTVPTQTVWFGCAFTVGVGLTVIVNVTGVPNSLRGNRNNSHLYRSGTWHSV